MKQLLPSFAFGIVGLMVILLSSLIKYKKQAWLIAGYNEDQVADKDGYCKWVGGVVLCFGIYTIFTAFLLGYWPAYTMYIVAAFALADVATVITVIRGARKYKKVNDPHNAG
ncbi:MAG: DUF3784 domain-containing protein [Mucilaginibacter sp.]